MKNLIILFLILFLYITLYSKNDYIVDCQNLKPVDIYIYSKLIKNLNINKIIISHPFQVYDLFSKSNDIVYSFDKFDSKNIKNINSFYDNYDNFLNLINYLKNLNIYTYVYLKLFYQKSDFNRNFWDNEDFIPNYYILPDIKIIDIFNPKTKEKLIKIINILNNIPIEGWIIDLKYIHNTNIIIYKEFLNKYLKSSIIVTDEKLNEPNIISSFDYWHLRQKVFCSPIENFINLTNYRLSKNIYYNIESDSTSLNNIATILYILSKKNNIVIPYNLINSSFTNFLIYLDNNDYYQEYIISTNKLLLYNKNSSIFINFNQNIEVIKFNNIFNYYNGFYASLIGDSIMSINNKNIYIFSLPMSINLWNLR